MHVLWLRARAPFAAYRPMQAGVYRMSLPVMPPSAAFGLLLNLAGIEIRDKGSGVTTGIRSDVPPLCIAVGALSIPEVSTLYQQLHGYPVGQAGKESKDRTKGAKYWIAPVRREVLVGLDVLIGARTEDQDLLDRVRRGLAGELDVERYGLPFAGDNNLLFDRLDLLDEPLPARWYTRVETGDAPRRGSVRLTVGIDREDSSRTTTVFMAPLEDFDAKPPSSAWVWTPRVPAGHDLSMP